MSPRSPCNSLIKNPLLLAGVGACLFGVITVVRISAQSFTTLYSFTALDSTGTNCDGAVPAAGLVLAGDTLFGTAYIGGDFGFGTVFSLNTNGSNFTTWFSFTGASDGASPGSLILSGNELFGAVA